MDNSSIHDSPDLSQYRQAHGYTNKPSQAPRGSQAQGVSAVVKEKNMVAAKEESKGKEVAQLDAEEPPPHVRQGHFRLMDLPAELRVYIYEFLLPHNMNISFGLKTSSSYYTQYISTRLLTVKGPPQWSVEMTSKGPGPVALAQESSLQEHGMSPMKRRRRVPLPKPEPAQTQLFLVSKAISTEAKAILYGSNTYLFTINSTSHQPSSLRSPQIFGAFGCKDRLPLLRNLRSISIDVDVSDTSHWDVKRLRTRLDYFVEILKQHADDASQASLLTQLTVYMADRPHRRWRVRNAPGRRFAEKLQMDRYMFGLEGLVGLTGIKHVTVGGVPDWYAKCLQLCVQGTGGEVQGTEWPLVRVKQAKGKRKKETWVSTRQWWQPVWNWKEFAERNGVEVPGDVDKYWMEQS